MKLQALVANAYSRLVMMYHEPHKAKTLYEKSSEDSGPKSFKMIPRALPIKMYSSKLVVILSRRNNS